MRLREPQRMPQGRAATGSDVYKGQDRRRAGRRKRPPGNRRLTGAGTVMRYVSTRGAAPVLDFGDALLAGLADDGGLYVPEAWPVLGRGGHGDYAETGGGHVAIPGRFEW